MRPIETENSHKNAFFQKKKKKKPWNADVCHRNVSKHILNVPKKKKKMKEL